MKFIHLIGRSLAGFFGSILLGAVLGGGTGLVVGSIILLITSLFLPASLFSTLIGSVCGAGFGFLYGAYHGFKIGDYLYQKYIEKNRDVIEPAFLSGRNDSLTFSNALLQDIQQLPKPDSTRLLTKDEILAYRQIILDKDDRMAKKHLDHYENWVNDAKMLSTTSLDGGLYLRSPVTIEHTKESRFAARTYEKNSLTDLIAKEKDNAKEPFKGYFLTSPNLHFYSGFPKWVMDFVKIVLTTLSKKTDLVSDAKNENCHSPLFQAPKAKTPTPTDIVTEECRQKFGMP